MNTEEWKGVPGFDQYQVSNLGRIKSLGNNKSRKTKLRKLVSDKDGYLCVVLVRDLKRFNFRVNRLVATMFVNNPSSLPDVNHDDGIKANNSHYNLKWVSKSENTTHAFSTGLHSGKGRTHWKSKLKYQSLCQSTKQS